MLRRSLGVFSSAPPLRRLISSAAASVFHKQPAIPAAALHEDMPLSPRQLQLYWDTTARTVFEPLNTLLAFEPADVQRLPLPELVARSSTLPPALAFAAAEAANASLFLDSLAADRWFDLHVHRHLAHRVAFDMGGPAEAVLRLRARALQTDADANTGAAEGNPSSSSSSSSSSCGSDDAAWAFLVAAPGGEITAERSAPGESPLTRGLLPLLALRVASDAYGTDYGSDRGRYVETVVRYGLNWDRAEVALAVMLHSTGTCPVPGHNTPAAAAAAAAAVTAGRRGAVSAAALTAATTAAAAASADAAGCGHSRGHAHSHGGGCSSHDHGHGHAHGHTHRHEHGHGNGGCGGKGACGGHGHGHSHSKVSSESATQQPESQSWQPPQAPRNA